MSNLDKAKQIDRLCAFWPHPAIERATMAAYGEAVANAHPADVRRAVDDFLFRRIDRNHDFIPSPGALSNQIVKAWDERTDEEARNRPRLAPPPIEPKWGSVEDRKAFVDRVMAKPFSRDFAVSGYDLERAKARVIKEALEAEQASLILRAAGGDPEAMVAIRAENEARGIARKQEAIAN